MQVEALQVTPEVMHHYSADPQFVAPLPYTHSAHAAACRVAACSGVVLAQRFVQVKFLGVTHCARLVEAWTTPNGVDLYKVHTLSPSVSIAHVQASKTLACSGVDGHCSCAGESF